jgi:PPOX class probable F420-dependent enzyme
VNEDEARRRFAGACVGRLATVRPDGRPHVVPFVFAVGGDRADRIYWAVDHKPKSSARLARLTNIEANPAVEAVVDHYEDDWSRLWWVRATGRARILTEEPERIQALELLAAKYPHYTEATPSGAVVRIDVDVWTWWAASRNSQARPPRPGS